MARLRGKHHLFHNYFGFARIFFEIYVEGIGHRHLHSAYDFAVAEFGLSLSFKLGFHHLY